MLLSIDHTTTYRFDEPPAWGLQRVRLQPVSHPGLRVDEWNLDIDGARIELSFLDHHRNHVDLLSFSSRSEIRIRAHGAVETERSDGIVDEPLSMFPLWLLSRPTALTEASDVVSDFAAGFDAPDVTEPGFFHDVSRAVADRVVWEEGTTTTGTTAADALAAGRGVCQDHAHVFLAVIRQLGFAGRYVSGYLMMNDRIDQAAMHAWVEVWIDGLGFVGYDVSNGISPDERYVRIAVGRDYREASPIAGTRYGAGDEYLDVALSVALQQQ